MCGAVSFVAAPLKTAGEEGAEGVRRHAAWSATSSTASRSRRSASAVGAVQQFPEHVEAADFLLDNDHVAAARRMAGFVITVPI